MPLVTRPPRSVAMDGRHVTTRATTSFLPVRSSAHLPLKRRTPGVPEHLVRLEAESGRHGEAQGLGEVFPDKAANFWNVPDTPGRAREDDGLVAHVRQLLLIDSVRARSEAGGARGGQPTEALWQDRHTDVAHGPPSPHACGAPRSAARRRARFLDTRPPSSGW